MSDDRDRDLAERAEKLAKEVAALKAKREAERGQQETAQQPEAKPAEGAPSSDQKPL